jgi:hypothetical protein
MDDAPTEWYTFLRYVDGVCAVILPTTYHPLPSYGMVVLVYRYVRPALPTNTHGWKEHPTEWHPSSYLCMMVYVVY